MYAHIRTTPCVSGTPPPLSNTCAHTYRNTDSQIHFIQLLARPLPLSPPPLSPQILQQVLSAQCGVEMGALLEQTKADLAGHEVVVEKMLAQGSYGLVYQGEGGGQEGRPAGELWPPVVRL